MKFSLTQHPTGWGIQNAMPTVRKLRFLFQRNVFWMFCVIIFHKGYLLGFWNFKFKNLFFKRLKFNIVASGNVSKLLLPQLLFSDDQHLLVYANCDSHHKSYLLIFRNINLTIKKIEVFVNMGPNGNEFFKTLLLQLWFLLNQTFFWMFPMTVLTKSCLQEFWKFKFNSF